MAVKKPKKAFAVLFTIALIICAAVFLINKAEKSMLPALAAAAAASVENAAQNAVDSAVIEASKTLEYDKIINIVTAEDGSLSAIRTDVSAMNAIKSSLALKILQNILQIDSDEISIPIGTVINSPFTYGEGPKIPIKIIPVGSVRTDIQSTFTAAGINQTVHRIIMTVGLNLNVVLPGDTISREFTTTVTLAETVLIGAVPDYYMTLPTALTKPE